MKTRHRADRPTCVAIEVFQPDPSALYSLDVAAHLAGVTRRAILVYCRAGLVRPVFQPPYGMMAFTEQAIHLIRRIERMQAVHGIDIARVKTMFDLIEEVDRLRAEVRFLRDN